jgi:large subunit ribosomal protein L22
MNKDNLYVAEVYVTQAPTMKRISYRAKGSADRILKRSSHITVVLDERK